MFNISLYVALLICAGGLVFRFANWFRRQIGTQSRALGAGERRAAFLKGLAGVFSSGRIFRVLWVFLRDGLLQLHLLREDPGRWAIHMAIFGGFMLLLLMHALDKYVTAALFRSYAATLNPFYFLRNLFGVVVLAGVVAAIVRRLRQPALRLTSAGPDILAIALLAVIMLTGFALEGTKIVSHVRFMEMAKEPGGLDEGEEELESLKAYWAKNFSVVFPAGQKLDFGQESLAKGQDSHDSRCAGCHSAPASAFVSFGFAALARPMAVALADAGVPVALWYIHFLACFAGLAYLPFSKFLHVFTTPLSLAINGALARETMDPANRAFVQALELDACTHCANCSRHCSVAAAREVVPNLAILPSEKLAAQRNMSDGRLDPAGLAALRQGESFCTKCRRCTDLCPAGINLQEMWFALKEDLTQRGQPETFSWARDSLAARPRPEGPLEPGPGSFAGGLRLTAQAGTFSRCFECQTCTNSCPVVELYDAPGRELGLLPHQIMHALGLGLREEAMSARMVWDCLTCYRCQENCPQGVRVTDVLYELKSQAVADLEKGEGR